MTATKTLKAVASIGYVLIVLSAVLLVVALLGGCDTGSVDDPLGAAPEIDINIPEDHGAVHLNIRFPGAPSSYACTGVLLAGEQGVIYTAKHCVHSDTVPASEILVCIGAPISICYEADVVLMSATTDQAVLQITDRTPEVIDRLEDTLGFGATICNDDEYAYGDYVQGYHHKGSHILTSYGVTHDEIDYIQSGNLDHGASGGPIWSLSRDCVYGAHKGDYGDWERFSVPSQDESFETVLMERCPAAFN